MRFAAVNSGPDFHLLDHIAPLAKHLQMPLLVEDEKNFSLLSHYYPMVEAELLPDIEFKLQNLADRFDVLFECKYWAPHLKKLFFDLYKKKMHLVFCSHGQSDKGYGAPLLAPYATQDLSLIYGPLLKDMLVETNVEAQSIFTGNYRLSFYLENKDFYDSLCEREIFSRLPEENKTLLYAPTWKDADSATSFFRSAKDLFSSLPKEWNLLVKVHPLLEMRDPAQYYRIASMLESEPNAILLSEFPPVYPLLAKTDVYLGDYSSVGYDFLYFERPMYFLIGEHLPIGRLHLCGKTLKSVTSFFSEMDKAIDYTQTQKKLYSYAFGNVYDSDSLRRSILNKLYNLSIE